jgi:hypothetical protein
MREIEELIHSAKGHARHDQTETPRAMIDRVCRCQRQVVKLQSKAMGKGGRELVSCLPGWLARREVPGTGWVLWVLGVLGVLGCSVGGRTCKSRLGTVLCTRHVGEGVGGSLSGLRYCYTAVC